MWIAMVDVTQTWVRSEVFAISYLLFWQFSWEAAFYKQSDWWKFATWDQLLFISHFVFRRQCAESCEMKTGQNNKYDITDLPRFGLTCTFAWRPHLLFHLQISEQSPRPVLIFPPQLLLEQPRWVTVSKSCWNLFIKVRFLMIRTDYNRGSLSIN